MSGRDLVVEVANDNPVDMSKISGSGRVLIPGGFGSAAERVTGALGPAFSLVTVPGTPNATGLGVFSGTNSGTILAQSPNIPLQLDGAWSNPTGRISATNGGVLIVSTFPGSFGDFSVTSAEVDLRVPLTTAQLHGIAASRATFGVENTLTNTNDTFALNGNETLKLAGIIVGGSITGTATDRDFVRIAQSGTLQNVAVLNLPLTVQQDAVLNASDLTLNGTAIHLQGGSFQSTTVSGTVLGTGEIVFDGPGSLNQLTATGGFVVNPGITVRTGASNGTLVASVNNGTVWAQSFPQTLTLSGAWDNTRGTIRASNGSTMFLLGTTSTPKLGNLVNDGGTITFGTVLDNTGQTFRFGGNQGTWNFSGEVTNGTVDFTGATLVPLFGAPPPCWTA